MNTYGTSHHTSFFFCSDLLFQCDLIGLGVIGFVNRVREIKAYCIEFWVNCPFKAAV